MSMRLHRRRFLQTSAAGTLGYFLTADAVSATRAYGANEKLSFAGIGVGGKGSSDINHAGGLGDVIAICDCDEVKKHLGWAAATTSSGLLFPPGASVRAAQVTALPSRTPLPEERLPRPLASVPSQTTSASRSAIGMVASSSFAVWPDNGHRVPASSSASSSASTTASLCSVSRAP